MTINQTGADYTLEDLRSERDRFVAFAFATADILVELDANGKIVFIDGATLSLLGCTSESLINKPFIELIDEFDQPSASKLWSNNTSLGRVDNMLLHLASASGELVNFTVSGYQLPYMQHHIYLTLCRTRSEVQANEVAQRDPKTGLLNRDTFTWEAQKKMAAAKLSGRNLTLSMLNMSSLGAVHSSLPGGAYETLLSDMCHFLRSASVDGDSAALLDDTCFGVLHDGTRGTESLAEQMRLLLSQAAPDTKVDVQSESVSLQPLDISEHDAARAILYTINRFAQEKSETFSISSLSEGYRQMLEDTLRKINGFKRTIVNDEFQVALQPIVDIRTSEVHHYETLVRLSNNDLFDNPFRFITFGEQAGIISEFDLAMCQRTLEVLATLAKSGHRPNVSVNVSGKSLSSKVFRDALHGMLTNHPEQRRQVLFEVTESAKIDDLQAANEFLQATRREGNLWCLDDFGVGESSFDYIRNLEVDYIKIDGSYIRNCFANERGKHILRAMIQVCQDFGIEIIGEMIETKDVAEFLWNSGVTYGQGYYFGKPTTDYSELFGGTSTSTVTAAEAPRQWREA